MSDKEIEHQPHVKGQLRHGEEVILEWDVAGEDKTDFDLT